MRPKTPEAFPPEFDQGNCRQLGIEVLQIMYPTEGDKVAEDIAKSVCSNCVVTELCLERAMRDGEQGVWGGKTQAERRTIHRKRVRNRRG